MDHSEDNGISSNSSGGSDGNTSSPIIDKSAPADASVQHIEITDTSSDGTSASGAVPATGMSRHVSTTISCHVSTILDPSSTPLAVLQAGAAVLSHYTQHGGTPDASEEGWKELESQGVIRKLATATESLCLKCTAEVRMHTCCGPPVSVDCWPTILNCCIHVCWILLMLKPKSKVSLLCWHAHATYWYIDIQHRYVFALLH